MHLDELREEVLWANLELKAKKLVICTWGNVSGFDAQRGVMLIKASGVPYEKMQAKHIVAVDLDGGISGEYAPSTDWRTHLALYRAFAGQGVGGIVHTHSKFATIWAQLGRNLPNCGTTHSDYFFGDVPCTRALTREEIVEDYEGNTGNVIVEAFREKSCRALPGVLVRGHAPFCWGAGPADAVHHAEILEYIAEMAAFDALLSKGHCPAVDEDIMKKHYERKFGPNAYYGQSEKI